MMREILFKAKAAMIVGTYNCGKEDGEWVVGHLYCDVGKWMIRQFEFDRADYVSYEVNPETVCQYTGWNDSSGNKIWENDVVEFSENERYLIWYSREMSMPTAISLNGIQFNGTDYWNGNNPQFTYADFCLMLQDPWGHFPNIRVVGNILDNPELLEV